MNKPHFIQIFFGGSSSGKSFFLSQKVVLDNLNGCNWLICRNVGNTIKKSVFNEITKAISRMNLSQYYRINRSDMVITCTLNNRQILFAGLDDPEKIKSVTPVDDVLHRVWVEEATETKREAYMQLKKRLRGKTASNISKCIMLSFNPILRSHWIYTEFFNEWADDAKLYENDNYGATGDKKGYSLCILKTTYKDNMFLTKDDRELLENESDPYYYQVYTLGNFGVLGHIVFKNWKVEDLSEQIPHFDNIRCGLDFGWIDETAMIKLHLDKRRKKIYIFGEVYQQYMTDDELLKTAKKFVGDNYVICDSAAPKSIDFLANNGVRAVGAVKGADSIIRGIRWLQDYEIIVDVNCPFIRQELELYHWTEDRNGNVLEKPVDANNHLIDSLRYSLEDDILQAEVTASKRIY